MKRQLILSTASICAALPLTAQEPGYPANAYREQGYYDSDDNRRHYTLNPGDMMSRMNNPVRDMFGSSAQGYENYPVAGYPAPVYPPAYGYPAYPGYQQPYPNYGYPQMPANQGYVSPYAYPYAQPMPAQPAPQGATQAPASRTPPAARDSRPRFPRPERGAQYRFRPLERKATPGREQPLPNPPATANTPPQPDIAPLYPEPAAIAPEMPRERTQPDLTAPYSHAGNQTELPAQLPETHPMQPQSQPRFRPLDKPGYSSELDQ